MNGHKELIGLFAGNWTSVCSTLLGREVRITVDSVEKKKRGEIQALLGGFESFVHLSYGEDSRRVMVIALANRLISAVTGRMAGPGTVEDGIVPDEKDIFVEAVNRMFSACQAPLLETLGLDPDFKDIFFLDAGEAYTALGPGTFKTWTCTMHFPDADAETFILVTPRRFGEKQEKRSEKAPVEAPSEAPCARSAPEPAPLAAAAGQPAHEAAGTGFILDLEVPITVRIGQTEMRLSDIMRLGPGSIIELEKMADEPVEVLVNGKLAAKGEAVVCDGNFAVRITEVPARAERIGALSR